MLKSSKKFKAKPNLVSLIIIIVAFPIVLNSFTRTPETVGDTLDQARVVKICSEMFDSNSIENEKSENCDDRTHRSEHPTFGVSLIGHMIGGSMMMLSAIINFNSNLLKLKRRLHRFSGYNFILGGIIAGSSAIIMTLFSPERFSSFNAFTNLLWGSLLLLYPLLAFRAIKRKDIQSHQSWMVRAYAVAAGPAAHRLFFFLTPIIGDFGVSVMLVFLGEAVIRKVRL